MKEVRRLSLRVLRDHEIRSLYVDFRNRPSEHVGSWEAKCTLNMFIGQLS